MRRHNDTTADCDKGQYMNAGVDINGLQPVTFDKWWKNRLFKIWKHEKYLDNYKYMFYNRDRQNHHNEIIPVLKSRKRRQ